MFNARASTGACAKAWLLPPETGIFDDGIERRIMALRASMQAGAAPLVAVTAPGFTKGTALQAGLMTAFAG